MWLRQKQVEMKIINTMGNNSCEENTPQYLQSALVGRIKAKRLHISSIRTKSQIPSLLRLVLFKWLPDTYRWRFFTSKISFLCRSRLTWWPINHWAGQIEEGFEAQTTNYNFPLSSFKYPMDSHVSSKSRKSCILGSNRSMDGQQVNRATLTMHCNEQCETKIRNFALLKSSHSVTHTHARKRDSAVHKYITKWYRLLQCQDFSPKPSQRTERREPVRWLKCLE